MVSKGKVILKPRWLARHVAIFEARVLSKQARGGLLKPSRSRGQGDGEAKVGQGHGDLEVMVVAIFEAKLGHGST